MSEPFSAFDNFSDGPHLGDDRAGGIGDDASGQIGDKAQRSSVHMRQQPSKDGDMRIVGDGMIQVVGKNGQFAVSLNKAALDQIIDARAQAVFATQIGGVSGILTCAIPAGTGGSLSVSYTAV